MNGVIDDLVAGRIEWEVSVDDTDRVRLPCFEIPNQLVVATAVGTLEIRELHDDDGRLSRSAPRASAWRRCDGLRHVPIVKVRIGLAQTREASSFQSWSGAAALGPDESAESRGNDKNGGGGNGKRPARKQGAIRRECDGKPAR
jgi:hypothetical protein